MSTESSDKSSREIQADIDQTRESMDQTIDALADRFQGRHLVDEVVGYFRSGASEVSDRAVEIKDKVTETASRAAQSVAATVKRHPVPTVLIGAGIAWIVYKRIKDSSDNVYARSEGDSDSNNEFDYDASDDDQSANGEDEPPSAPETSGPVGKIGAAAASMRNQIKERAAQVRQKAEEIGSEVEENTRRVYERSRDQVIETVQTRPVEVGLGLLALGVLVGLALPTSDRVNKTMGPRVDKLRDRAKDLGKDLLERSKHVAQAATDAARREAQAQGFTAANLRGKNTNPGSELQEGRTARPDGPIGFAANPSPAPASTDGLSNSSAAEI